MLGQSPTFEAVQPELFAPGGTFTNAWADYDGDGDLDLFVGFDGAPNRLYRNERGTFGDTAAAAGVADSRPTRAVAWGDFDADGDPDLLVGFAPLPQQQATSANASAASVLRLYRNTKGRFENVTDTSGLFVAGGAVRQPAWVDIDADGDLDLFVAFRDRANAMFRNTGGGFVDVAQELGLADARRTVGAVWFDYDDDSDLDLAVANMDGDGNGLFRNDQGRFTDVAVAAGVAWGGRAPGEKTNGTVRLCAADVNNDGRFDLFAANYGPNGLLLNRGDGSFADASGAWGVAIDARYDSCAFADIDHDGDVDLYVNGTVTGGTSYRDHLFRNTGSRFEDITPDSIRALHADHGVQWADYDADGDLDLALTGAQKNGMHSLFRNVLPSADAARSLTVRVLDMRGRATLPGASVRVYAAGTTRLIGAGIVDAGSGYDSQNDMPVHIGLPALEHVDVHVRFGRGADTIIGRVDPRNLRPRPLVIRHVSR